MKEIVMFACTLLATIIILGTLFVGLCFVTSSLKDYFKEKTYGMVLGLFGYTASIVAITLLVRWAFS